MRIAHRGAWFACIALVAGCDFHGSAPSRTSPPLSESSAVPSNIDFADLFEGRTYAMAYDARIYDVADPSTIVVDGSALTADGYVEDFHMASATSAWILVSGAIDGPFLYLVGSEEEVIGPYDVEPLLDATDTQIADFDVGPNGELWIATWSSRSVGALGYPAMDTFGACVRPASGSFSCSTSSTIANEIVALSNGAMVGGPGLAYVSDTITELAVPGGDYEVNRIDAMDGARVFVETTDMYQQPMGYYAVDAAGTASRLFDPVQVIGTPALFVRSANDILLATYEDEWDEDCNPFSLGTCTAGNYVWQQFVVWHWNGSELREIGHSTLSQDFAEGYYLTVLPEDERTFVLEAGERGWTGTR